MGVRRPDALCHYCKTVVSLKEILLTRKGEMICAKCQIERNLCEVCGSIKAPEQSVMTQLHYEEECFK